MRFTIRDLLWLTLLVAVAVAWWVDRSRLEQTVNTQADDIARLNKEMENWPQVRIKWPIPNSLLKRLKVQPPAQNLPSD